MTNDEKAKAYEMALEAARKELGVDRKEWEVVQRVLHNIFPELRESEDERVIKALETFINQPEIADKITFEARIEWLSWLEKQKENPKNADSIPEDCVPNAKCEDRWHKTANSLPDTGRDVLAKDALGNYLLASFDGAQWFVSVYDGQDHPVIHTPPILEWCDIPSEKQKEPKQTDLPAGFYFIDLDGNKYYSKEFRYGDMKVKVGEQKPVVEESNDTDWSAFRREAAKDILCAMISTTNGANPKDVTTAIEIADELIKQLREEKK